MLVWPKELFSAWLAGVDTHGVAPTLEELRREASVYLIRLEDLDTSNERVLGEYATAIFGNELCGWSFDEEC